MRRGIVRPFALTSGAQLRPSTGPRLHPSGGYTLQATQLLRLSAGLTDRHKAIAEYWADGPATELPPGHWCLLAQQVSRRHGFDLDAPSIELAHRHAAQAGVADRVRFHVRDAGDPALAGRYDLVLICEALHDLSRPVEALRTMRRLAAADGAVLVVDERAAEEFTAPADNTERLFYGYSVLCCLPAGMSEQPSAATGTVFRPATLRRYAVEAGFRDAQALPIQHDMFRVYRLVG